MFVWGFFLISTLWTHPSIALDDQCVSACVCAYVCVLGSRGESSPRVTSSAGGGLIYLEEFYANTGVDQADQTQRPTTGRGPHECSGFFFLKKKERKRKEN